MKIDNIPIDYFNPYPNLVRGYQYIVIFFNGAEFNFWTGRKLNRKQTRQAAILIANGDYKNLYTESDIVSVRQQNL